MRVVQSARYGIVLATVVAGMAASGCRPGSALGNRFNNFRAYYNTFYNAERALEVGEDQLEQASVTVDRSRLVSVFPATSGTGQDGTFQEAIDKSAELLRNRPDSKWADDALLVIGKAYFYQRNLAGAEQKFLETIAAAGLTEDRRLGDEAVFWLGRTYASMNRFDEGIATLEGGIGRDGVDRRWAGRMQIALGELYARAQRWDEAAAALEAGAPTEGKADVAARAFVLLGQVEEHLGRFEDAAEAYRRALEQKPAYELAFSAEVGRALVLGLETDRSGEALRTVRQMRGDDKHYPRRAELALAEARIRARAGERAQALALYRGVLYDEDLGGAAVRGEAHYRLSQFYRDVLDDYVRASAHLDTAATALRVNPDDRPPARGAVLDVADEARTYGGLAASARRLAEVDSLMTLGALSEDDFRARIGEIEAERRRVYVEEQRALEAERRAQQFAGGGAFESRPDPRTPAVPTGAPAANAGFLSYRSPASVQAGLISFQQRWGDRPLVPNWRRRASIQAGAVAVGRTGVEGDVDGGLGFGPGPPPLDLFQVPRTPAKRDEMVVEMAGLRYELANSFFLQLGRADTAAALYRSILEDTPDLPVAVRARYALAEIERAAGRDDVARPLYESVLEADSLALGRASRERLGLAPLEGDGPVVEDAAVARYDAARERWQAGDPLGAAADLVRLGDRDPEHPVAPRAYLAAGVAYVDWAAADSLVLRSALPDSLVSEVLLGSERRAVLEDGPAPAERVPDGEDPAERVAPDDQPVEGDPVEGDPVEGDPVEGDPVEGDPVEGDLVPDVEAPPPLPAAVPEPVGSGEDEPSPVEGEAPAPLRSAPAQASGGDGPTPPADALEDDLLEDDLLEDDLLEDERDVGSPALEVLGATPADPSPTEPPAALEVAAPAVGAAPVTVADHLRAVARRYPGGPFAERASALADDLAPAPTVPPAAATDSAAVPVGVEEPGFVTVPVTDLEAEPGGLRGPEPLDPDQGGFTWNVRTLSIPDEGASTVDVLREAGFRVAVLQDLELRSYVIAIGQFETEGGARAARGDLPAWARFRGEVVRIDAYAVPAVNTDF